MDIDIPIMSSYFDESMFLDAWIFKDTMHPVFVFNRADAFIIHDIHNIPVIETCQVHDNNYSLNPINPWAPINIYSLDNKTFEYAEHIRT